MSISVGEFLKRVLDGRTLLDKVDPWKHAFDGFIWSLETSLLCHPSFLVAATKWAVFFSGEQKSWKVGQNNHPSSRLIFLRILAATTR